MCVLVCLCVRVRVRVRVYVCVSVHAHALEYVHAYIANITRMHFRTKVIVIKVPDRFEYTIMNNVESAIM